MAKYKSRKVGEIHQLEKEKTDWGGIIGGIVVLVIILSLLGSA